MPFTSSLLPFDFLLKVGIFYLENNVKIESPSLCFFQVPWGRLIDHYVISGAEPRGSWGLARSTDTLNGLARNLSFTFIVIQVTSFSLGLVFLSIKWKRLTLSNDLSNSDFKQQHDFQSNFRVTKGF